jgi:hypothetical protein
MTRNIINKNFCSLLLILFIFSSSSFSQTGSVSPYSRYGIGEIAPEGFTFQSGMSGIGAAWLSSTNINFLNPASYYADTSTLFEFGARGEIRKLERANATSDANSASFSHFSLAFPVIKNKLSAAFGLLPYSSVGYRISVTTENVPNIGDITYKYEGAGGFNKVFIGAGLKLLPNLSAGVNASYLFGTIENRKSIEFPSGTNFFNSKFINGVTAKGFYFDYGLLYNRNLKKDFRFTAGVTAALSSSVNAVNNTYYYNYLLSNLANGVEVVKDSIFNETKTKGSIVLPDYIKAGITISKSSKWTAGLDFSFQNWKKYRNFESTDTLDNSYRIATGGEYRTDKLIYRFGAHYGKSFINLRSTQLNDAGISVGLGILRLFPKRPPSSINIAIEVGQRGTTDNNLIREKYIRLHLGFTLSDIWFVKPKYD